MEQILCCCDVSLTVTIFDIDYILVDFHQNDNIIKHVYANNWKLGMKQLMCFRINWLILYTDVI